MPKRPIALRRLVMVPLAAIALLLTMPSPQRDDGTAEAAINRGHVYLIRGIGNIFSLGMDSLAAKLRARGVRQSVTNHLTWSTLADRISAEYKRNKRLAPVILVGHSLGGNAVLLVASKLGKAGVPVRLLVVFDATEATPVSANVAEAINYYYPGGRGDALKPGPGFKGRIRNDDLRDLPALKHMNIDESATLHKRVVAKVLSVLG
jgi:pimeloyl-ACP methyl ester carboxylesterase